MRGKCLQPVWNVDKRDERGMMVSHFNWGMTFQMHY